MCNCQKVKTVDTFLELFQSLNSDGQNEVMKFMAYIASQDKYNSVKSKIIDRPNNIITVNLK